MSWIYNRISLAAIVLLTPNEGLKPQDRNEAIFRLRQHMAGIELSEQQIAVVLGESVG